MMDGEAACTQEGFAFDSLEAVRKKLLDLSGRNALLNYRHPNASCARLIDELPDQVALHLQAGKQFTFTPVPEPTETELIQADYIQVDSRTGQKTTLEYPTAEQWATYLGLNAEYDLPAQSNDHATQIKHQDTKLQTMLYAPALEARLRGLRNRSETAIEESGANILFLAIGFLEWNEKRDSTVVRMAPLMTLPVRLERTLSKKGRAYHYTITLKDDAILTNITLREKLANDFNLILPLVEGDMRPEDYFEQVRLNVLRHQPQWKIRRYTTLALLNFSKQAMYEDLNPEHWPSEQKIQNHPIISHFFGTGNEECNKPYVNYAEEYPIDHIEDIHERFPLIYDADSSQHSALIDAVKGENLVIEGPPGSGKSQTITNLIAACIANGKTVLFVAEKMAALNIVKSRLDKAGLGDFCLELHSHKTQKQKIINDLNIRLSKQKSYRLPHLIDDEITRYEELKSKLCQYAELMNSPWGKTGQSIHQILNKATRYREQLNLNPDAFTIEGIDSESLTPIRRMKLMDQTEMLASIYEQVSEQAPEKFIFNHYWYGVNNIELQGYQVESFCQTLQEWTKFLSALSACWENTSIKFHFGSHENISLPEIISITTALGALPDLLGGEQLEQLAGIIESEAEYETLLAKYERIHKSIGELAKSIKANSLSDAKKTLSYLTDILHDYRTLGVTDSLGLHDLAKDCAGMESALASIEKIDSKFQLLVSSLPSELHQVFEISANGLREFTTFVKLLDQLPVDLWCYRDELYDNPDLECLIKAFIHQFTVILPLHEKLTKHFNLQQLPTSDQLQNYQESIASGGLFSWFSSDWHQARKAVFALSNHHKPDKRSMLNHLPILIKYAKGLESIEKIHRKTPILGNLYCGIETPLERIYSLHKWYKTVRKEYGIGFGDRVELGSKLLALDSSLALAISDAAEHGLFKECTELTGLITFYKARYKKFMPMSKERLLLKAPYSPFDLLFQNINPKLKMLESILRGSSYSMGDVERITRTLEGIHQQQLKWDRDARLDWFGEKAIPLSINAGEYSKKNISIAKNMLEISQLVKRYPALLKALEFEPTVANYLSLVGIQQEMHQYIDSVAITAKEFENQGDVSFEQWNYSSKEAINTLIDRNERALAHPLWLSTWLDYKRLCKRLSGLGMSKLLQELEIGNILPAMLKDVLEMVINSQLAHEAFIEHESLTLFSGLEQMAIRDKFQRYDKNILELQRHKIAYRASRTLPLAGNSKGKVSSFTDTALIQHEGGKKSRLIPVRSLIERAGGAIRAIKPCFMMSPMSVAQYLTPGKFKFDLVVMDEASQIRPEDALGSIARGDSLIVVGDPKQLPPTSFFQKVMIDEDNEDMVALQDSESILDSVLPMFKTRRLRWHYRSRHESLIDFSNKQFYDSNLILFPSPFQQSKEFGIRFMRVENGRFLNRRNIEEAMRVVQDVRKQLINNPDESVGVVAMNTEQRDEIERQFEQILKDEHQLQAAYERNSTIGEPLFIKNLENVQGDERDIIVISMTYGPNQAGGKVTQRFGPINSDVGWRRLNVLFTRSKKRMHILSSMSSGDIVVGGSSKRGIVALKAFLNYCETGYSQQAVHIDKPADSDFEIAVTQALSGFGYECEPQLGVAGYFLDLAVKDPGMPGRFLMAIECDGATYHSAKSARDRDRLRQEILEGLGWNVRRIWSTDWFKNPQAQLQPILTELETLKTTVAFDNIQTTQTSLMRDNDSEENTAIFEHTNANSLQNDFRPHDVGLRDCLLRFDQAIIRKEHPNADENSRLLRLEMLNAIVDYTPCSKADFLECIPKYLRVGTSDDEMVYLNQILELVSEYA